MLDGVETGREIGRGGQIRSGLVEEQCFKFGVKELCRDRYTCMYICVFVLFVHGNMCLNMYYVHACQHE